MAHETSSTVVKEQKYIVMF